MSFTWAFGDGVVSNEANPAYIYTIPGPYVATLTVKDSRGATTTESIFITVGLQPDPSCGSRTCSRSSIARRSAPIPR